MTTLARTLPRTLSVRQMFAASLLGAAVTAVCAQIAIPLPGHPVPITLQLFAVACCGMVLGSRWGAIAQLQYLAAGLLGAPVFAFGKAGPAALAGPTGGYLVGFVAAAFVIGLLLENTPNRTLGVACTAGLAGVAVVYACGSAWLALWSGPALTGWIAWVWGSAPYIGVDALKVLLAARLFTSRSLAVNGFLKTVR